MNTLPLLIAEVTNWPGAISEIAVAVIGCIAVCKIWTGDWPWQSRR